MRTIAALLLLFAVSAVADDSPLVAASKKSRRRDSKTPVITNKDLAKSGGHVTTTKSQRDVPKVKAPAAKKPAPPPIAAPAKADVPVTLTEPVDDATAYGPEDRDPDNIHDPIPSATLPAALTSKPVLTKPAVVAPVKPPVSKSTTPQYTQDKH